MRLRGYRFGSFLFASTSSNGDSQFPHNVYLSAGVMFLVLLLQQEVELELFW